jgi:hypothetical protein
MKNLSPLIITLFLLLCSQTLYSQTSLPEKTQSWNEVQLIIPLEQGEDSKGKKIDKITMTLGGIFRFGRKNWDIVDNRYSVTFDFRVNKFLSLMAATLYRKEEQILNRRNYETRLNFGFVLSKTLKKFNIRDRNMYERRFRNSRADLNLYRNRLNISYPIFHKEKELFSPFISEEAYLDLQTGRWVQNEFYAGISRKLTPKITLDLSYIRNDSSPINVNGLSTSLRIKFR